MFVSWRIILTGREKSSAADVRCEPKQHHPLGNESHEGMDSPCDGKNRARSSMLRLAFAPGGDRWERPNVNGGLIFTWFTKIQNFAPKVNSISPAGLNLLALS